MALIGLSSCTSGGSLTEGLSRTTAEATEVFSVRVEEAFADGMDQEAFLTEIAELGFVLLSDERIQVSRPSDQGPVVRATIFANLSCSQYALITWTERDGMVTDIKGWTTSSGC